MSSRRRLPYCAAALALLLGSGSPLAVGSSGVADDTLYLVPRDVEIPHQVGDRATLIHNYGPTALWSLPRISSDQHSLLSQLTAVQNPARVSYRGWQGSWQEPVGPRSASFSPGYRIVGFVGPIDPAWRSAIERAGVVVVDTAQPYAVVVHLFDREQAVLIQRLQTSTGGAAVGGVMDVPRLARLDVALAGLAAGTELPADVNVLHSADGRAVVRVLSYSDVDPLEVGEAVGQIAEAARADEGWGHPNTFLVQGPEIESILDVPGVAFVQGVHDRELDNNISAKDTILNIEPVWTSLGYDGAGVIVGHNDGGVNLTHPDFPSGVIVATNGAMSGTDNEHGTHTAGSIVGRGLAPGGSPNNTSGCGDVTTPFPTVLGMAPGAQLATNNLFDGGYTTETLMMRWSSQQGALLNTNSWSYTNLYSYATYSVTVDTLVRDADSNSGGNQELCILFSAGNDGPSAGTVKSPSNAKNAITVGANQNDRCGSYVPSYQSGPSIDTITTFSSRGPAQGRVKPDVVAVGADVLSVDSLNCVGTGCTGWDQSWTGTYYRLMPGTSMSTPITAGATAVFYEFYNAFSGAFPSPALAKAAIINGAVDNGDGYPSYDQGWGRIDLRRSIEGPPGGHINFVDQSDVPPLATGASWSRPFVVYSSSLPLEITVVWTDVPGSAGSTSPLVNDLDLVVTAPDSTVYRGNRLTASWSTPNPGATTDTDNNVENVFVQTPQPGGWTIEVSSANTAQNPPGLSGQDFAVVYSGDCGDCTPPAAPTGLGATASADNEIELNWTASATPGVTEYRVYRALTSGGPYTYVGTPTPPTNTSYTDTTVLGGATYYYVVRAFLDCESLDSNETSATAFGSCTVAPSFDPDSLAVTPLGDACGLRLEWGAGISNCGGGVVYNIYRDDTSSSFTPDPTPGTGNMIASCVTGTSYDDTQGVGPGDTRYYIVRAEDSTVGNGGPCNDGNEEGNASSQEGMAPAAYNQDILPLETFDAIGAGAWPAGWATGTFSGFRNDWRGARACPAMILRWGSTGCTGAYRNSVNSLAVSASATVPGDAETVVAQFSHKHQFGTNDGGILYLSPNGSNFRSISLSYLGGYAYNGTANGLAAFTGESSGYNATAGTFHTTVVDLAAFCNAYPGDGYNFNCQGNTVYFGFNGYSDNTGTNLHGWFVDDVVITATASGCTATAPDPLPFLTATSTANQNLLEWVNPDVGGGSVTTRVCWDSTGFPTDPDSCGANQHDEVGTSGAYDAWPHPSLNNDQTYYYTAWVAGSGVYSAATTVSGRPQDTGAGSDVKWVYNTGATALAPPGIGSVYGVSNDRALHSMGAGSGGGSWPSGWTPMAMNGPAQGRPPVVSFTQAPYPGADAANSKVVFLGSQDGFVHAVNADSGEEIAGWTSPNLGLVQAAPAGIFSHFGSGVPDLILVGTRNAGVDNALVAMNLVDGGEAWRYGPAGTVGIVSGMAWVEYGSPPAVPSRVYFASRERTAGAGTLWCLEFDASSANLCGGSWPVALGDIDGSPVLRSGRVYVGNNAGQVFAVEAGDGSLVWTDDANRAFDTGDGPVKGYVWPDPSSSRLYLSTSNTVWALEDTGTNVGGVWVESGVTNPSTPLVVIGGSHVYVGSGDGRQWELDVSGAGSRSIPLGDAGSPAAVGSPAIDVSVTPNLLYAGTESGAVYAVEIPLS